MQRINEVKLTSEQERKWIQTRSALLWTCPAFTHILFSMMTRPGDRMAAIFTDEIPIAATDGRNMILNPLTYFNFSLGERVFIAAHEIMHCILNHCAMMEVWRKSEKVKYVDGVELDYDMDQMNMAMDYIINDILIKDKVGKFPTVGLHDENIGTAKDNSVDVYRKIFRKSSGMGGAGSGTGNPAANKGFDKLLRPGTGDHKDPGQAVQERSETEWATAVAAAIASAKLQGKLPAGIERLLSEVLEPTVDWSEHVRAFLARKVGGGGYDWKKADKRMIIRDIFHPRRSGTGCGTIVLGCDTSGSVTDPMLAQYFGELRGLLADLRPSKVYVVWCDAAVHKVDEVDDEQDIGGLKPHGGGGTDFRPVFQWIDDNDIVPEALIYLTDGYGTFPDKQPNYPVLWGDIVNNPNYPEWGDVVHVEIPNGR